MKYPTGIEVTGPKVKPEAVEALTEGIERVLDASFRNHADQETVRHALSKLGQLGCLQTTISGCSVSMVDETR